MARMIVTAQIALDLPENKENTRSVLLHSSMFDAVIGRIKGDLSSYGVTNATCAYILSLSACRPPTRQGDY